MDATIQDSTTSILANNRAYSDFRYPVSTTGSGGTLSTHLNLKEVFGVELHDFNIYTREEGYLQVRDDYIDSVTSEAIGARFVSRLNTADFDLKGSGRYFSEESPLTARDLIGKDYHDVYEYVYAVNQIRHGSGVTISGPAMRVVSEAVELGWGVAVVPQEILELAQGGYDQYYAQAMHAASEGQLADAYRDLEQVVEGYALLGIDFDVEAAVARLNENLEDSKVMNIFSRARLTEESEALAVNFFSNIGAGAKIDELAIARLKQ